MQVRGVGIIGGGRVARIMLSGWQRAGRAPAGVIVTDVDAQSWSAFEPTSRDLPGQPPGGCAGSRPLGRAPARVPFGPGRDPGEPSAARNEAEGHSMPGVSPVPAIAGRADGETGVSTSQADLSRARQPAIASALPNRPM